MITLHNVRQAKIETDLVVVGFGIPEDCGGEGRVLLMNS
jgi:hypothetical protein